jgi:hypothetical protein
MIEPEEEEKVKPVISKKEWAEKLDKVTLPKRDLNKLIMNFFLIEGIVKTFRTIVGYRDAAENFKKESGTDSKRLLKSLNLKFLIWI